MNDTRCSCERCVRMCKTRPCIPTPEEASRLDKTMRVRFGEILVTTPAMVGKEGQEVDGNETGRCVYLHEGLCQLHAKGLKPLEGRLAHHSRPWREVRGYVVSKWTDRPVVFV